MANKKYNRRTSEEKLQEIKELSSGALEKIKEYTHSPESLIEYADFMSRFYNYSPRNNTLIQKQFEGAKAVASFKDWTDKGYQINKGEKGIKILSYTPITKFKNKEGQEKQLKNATKEEKEQIKNGTIKTSRTAAYSIGHVFDVSQTNAKPEDLPEIFPNRLYDFQVEEGSNTKYLSKGIESLANDLNIEVKDMNASELGFTELGVARGAFVQSGLTRNEILLNNRNTETQNLAVSIHELAHRRLHVLGSDGSGYDTPTKEFQAELTSYIVCKHYGMDTSDFSIPYIAQWTSNGQKVEDKQKVLEEVHYVAKEFMESIDQTIISEREEDRSMNLNYESKLLAIQKDHGLNSKDVQLENMEFGDHLRFNHPKEFEKYLTYSTLYQYENEAGPNNIKEPMMLIHGVNDRLESFGKVNDLDLSPYKFADTMYTVVIPNDKENTLESFTAEYESNKYVHPLHHLQKENLTSKDNLKQLENSWHDHLIKAEENGLQGNEPLVLNSIQGAPGLGGYKAVPSVQSRFMESKMKTFGSKFYDVNGSFVKHVEGTDNLVIGKNDRSTGETKFVQLSDMELNILDYSRELDDRSNKNLPIHGFTNNSLRYTSSRLNIFKDDLISKGFSEDQAKEYVLNDFKETGILDSHKSHQMEQRMAVADVNEGKLNGERLFPKNHEELKQCDFTNKPIAQFENYFEIETNSGASFTLSEAAKKNLYTDKLFTSFADKMKKVELKKVDYNSDVSDLTKEEPSLKEGVEQLYYYDGNESPKKLGTIPELYEQYTENKETAAVTDKDLRDFVLVKGQDKEVFNVMMERKHFLKDPSLKDFQKVNEKMGLEKNDNLSAFKVEQTQDKRALASRQFNSLER